MYSLNEFFPIFVDNVPSWAKEHLRKNSTPGIIGFFCVAGHCCPRDYQNTTGHCYSLVCIPEGREVGVPITENTAIQIPGPGISLTVTNLKASFLRTSFHGTKKCHVCFQRWKSTKSAIQIGCLWITALNSTTWQTYDVLKVVVCILGW